MDMSKHFFQLHGVNATEEPVPRKKLRHEEMFALFQKLAPTVIATETCGASHHRAARLQSFGHTVTLIVPPGQTVHQASGTARMMRRTLKRFVRRCRTERVAPICLGKFVSHASS